MQNKILLCFIFLNSICYSQLQETEISGHIQFENETTPLEGAKIIIQDHSNQKNKSLGLSNSNGGFSITHQTDADTLDIIITYILCTPHFQTIIPRQHIIKLDTIKLFPDEELLNTVTVTAKPNPVTIKNDTIRYYAAAFKTGENAYVEELLEVLPGVMVDSEGNITVNGEKVDKILVDGKPFFGDDLKAATRNLLRDMILAVEVSDSKSKSEAFIGSEGSSGTKTINLILKLDKKRGTFGEVSAGIGFENKYTANGILNRFSKSQRISLIGSANNINAPRFSGQGSSSNLDLLQNSGREGVSSSTSIGVNFSDELSDKLELTGNYMITETKLEKRAIFKRETNLPESFFFTIGSSASNNTETNHTINLGIDYQASSNLLINISPALTLKKNDAISFQNVEQLNANLESTNLQEQTSKTNQFDNQFKNKFTLTQRIGKDGGAFKLILSHQNSQLKKENANSSSTLITADPEANATRNQLIENTQKKNYYTGHSSYKIPIQSKAIFLTVGVTSNYNNIRLQQQVQQLLEVEESNAELDFKMNNIQLDFLPNIILSAKKNKWRASFKSTYVSKTRAFIDHAESNNNNKRVFRGLEINSNFNYQMKNGLNINSGYQLQNNPPSLSQVQTFPNLINPLNVIIGNPALRSAYDHQIKLGLNSFNFKKNRTLLFFATLAIKTDQIIRILEVDENFFKTTTYVNASGGYNLSTMLNYNKKIIIDSLSRLNITLGVNSSLNTIPSMNYGLNYRATTASIRPSIKASISRAQWLRLDVEYGLSAMQTSFDIPNFETRTIALHSAGITTNIKFAKHFTWNNSTAFNYSPSISDPYERFNWIWNTGINLSFKSDKARLSLNVFDVLNKNRSVNRIVTSTYIEDSNRLVLTRYVMLSLSCKLSKM